MVGLARGSTHPTWVVQILMQRRLLEDPALDVGQGVDDEECGFVDVSGDPFHLADLQAGDDAEEDFLVESGLAPPPLVDRDPPGSAGR